MVGLSQNSDQTKRVFSYSKDAALYGSEGFHIGADFDFHNHSLLNLRLKHFEVSNDGSNWKTGWTGTFQDGAGKTINVIDGIIIGSQ